MRSTPACSSQLKQFVGTETGDIVILSSSGTGAMEASVSNLTSPGDRVLVLTAGKFGERWTSLCKAFGCHVDVVEAPYGQTFSIDQVKAALKLETRAVFMQATETSTGVRHCVPAVAKLLKETQSEALLVVDAITGLGTSHLDMDALGIDVLIGGSQKAVMIPPGLSYLAVGPKAWDRMEASYNPRYYFDLRKERKNARAGESAYTPAVALIAALDAALAWIAAQAATAENPAGDIAAGRRKLVENAETIAAMTRAAVLAMGCTLFRSQCSFRCGNGGAAAGGRGLRAVCEGAEVTLWRHHYQWPGRDEGPDLPHRAPRLLRLHGHHRADRRTGTGDRQEPATVWRAVWRGVDRRAEALRGAQPDGGGGFNVHLRADGCMLLVAACGSKVKAVYPCSATSTLGTGRSFGFLPWRESSKKVRPAQPAS